MKFNTLLTALLSGLAFYASADCYGTDTFKTCYDVSGNTYTVQNIGSSTFVQGTNLDGDSWTQDTYRTGSMSQTYGTDANGNLWNSTSQSLQGGGSVTYGTDSSGDSFSTFCDSFGNCY
ncbi:hypothetical protein WM008_01285 [Vibrio vulnificus]|uniref:hypothetical protein n=1 Tax=Vibrio vulnificus TaxID=672 RepID=UPI0030EC7D4C